MDLAAAAAAATAARCRYNLSKQHITSVCEKVITHGPLNGISFYVNIGDF